MTSLTLSDVAVNFPVYGAGSRSLRKTVARVGTGGRLARGSNDRLYVQALRDISLEFTHGDRIGLVGPNGAGKSTLLRVLAGIYEPSSGTVESVGRSVAIFDPVLGMDMEATGYENIMLRGLIMGLHPREIEERSGDVADFTELGDYLAMPVRTYSTGMMLRLAFAIATSIVPDILLLDEWISAGDAQFMSKAEKRMEEFIGSTGILVIASHSHPVIRRWCTKAVLLDHGVVRSFGPVDEVLPEAGESPC